MSRTNLGVTKLNRILFSLLILPGIGLADNPTSVELRLKEMLKPEVLEFQVMEQKVSYSPSIGEAAKIAVFVDLPDTLASSMFWNLVDPEKVDSEIRAALTVTLVGGKRRQIYLVPRAGLRAEKELFEFARKNQLPQMSTGYSDGEAHSLYPTGTVTFRVKEEQGGKAQSYLEISEYTWEKSDAHPDQFKVLLSEEDNLKKVLKEFADRTFVRRVEPDMMVKVDTAH